MFGINKRPSEEEVMLTRSQMLLQKILYEDTQRLQFTPDYRVLSQKKACLIFIHDDMMQLQPNHLMVQCGLSGFYPLGYGYTSRNYSFIKKELGQKSFPVALDLRNTDELPMYMVEKHRIRGEIYAVRPQTIIDLDIHRQNGVQFTRTKVNINIGFRKRYKRTWFNAEGIEKFEHFLGKDEMISQEMQMYIGREEYWKDQLQAGFFDFKPVDIIQEDRIWLKEYYQYSRVR